MSTARLRIVLLATLGLTALAFVVICILGLSVLGRKSQQMTDLKLQSKVLEAQLNNLVQAKKEVEQYSYFKDVAKTVIPNDKDQAKAVLEIVQLANQSGISIQSISFPTSNLGVSTSISPTTGGTTTPSSSAAISQAKPVSSIPGLYSLELTITPEAGPQVAANKQVTYSKMLDFLSKIERNRRTAQITQVNINPLSTDTGQLVDFSLNVNIFIKP